MIGVPSMRFETTMRRVDHFGIHTIIRPDRDGNWPMPLVDNTGIRDESSDRWDDDGYGNAAEKKRKIPVRHFETILLAAAAKCYRGEISLKELPKIPVDLATKIIREGGLVDWINFTNRRLEKFWNMAEAQSRAHSIGTARGPKTRRNQV